MTFWQTVASEKQRGSFFVVVRRGPGPGGAGSAYTSREEGAPRPRSARARTPAEGPTAGQACLGQQLSLEKLQNRLGTRASGASSLPVPQWLPHSTLSGVGGPGPR